jgi:hypothetical protein
MTAQMLTACCQRVENNQEQVPASSLGTQIYLLSRLLFSSSNGEIPVFGLET